MAWVLYKPSFSTFCINFPWGSIGPRQRTILPIQLADVVILLDEFPAVCVKATQRNVDNFKTAVSEKSCITSELGQLPESCINGAPRFSYLSSYVFQRLSHVPLEQNRLHLGSGRAGGNKKLLSQVRAQWPPTHTSYEETVLLRVSCS